MRSPSLLLGAVLGAVATFPVVGLSYLGEQLAHFPFVPFDLFDWLARVLLGRVITAGIDTIVGVIGVLGLGPIDAAAKRIEQLLGILSVVAGGALLGALAALALRCRPSRGREVGVAAGLMAFLFLASVERHLSVSRGLAALLWLALLTWIIQRAVKRR